MCLFVYSCFEHIVAAGGLAVVHNRHFRIAVTKTLGNFPCKRLICVNDMLKLLFYVCLCSGVDNDKCGSNAVCLHCFE